MPRWAKDKGDEMKKIVLVMVSFFVGSSALAALDMAKFEETMNKTKRAIEGTGILMKKVPAVLENIKQTVALMKKEVAAFKATDKASIKIDKLAEMNKLIIKDLNALAMFISDIGSDVIVHINPKPAEETQKVSSLILEMLDMIVQVNEMLMSLSSSIAVFDNAQ